MRSMTGFGSAVAEGPSGTVRAEVRSVNHRNLKVSLRLPSALASREPDLEGCIRERVARGSLQADLALERRTAPTGPLVDAALARAYVDRLSALGAELGLPGEPDLALVASLPGVVVGAAPGAAEVDALGRTAEEALRAALDALDASRAREGKALLADMEKRIGRVSKALARVQRRAPRVLTEARRRLARRVAEVLRDQPAAAAGEALAREAVLLAQRSDVTEEVTRLRTHVESFLSTARGEGEIGRRLDFLLQEMLREVNTIGSKSQDAGLAAAVVDMKVEVDRMKEQAANVE